MWRLAKSLTKVGHETHVVATTPHEAFEEEREGIPTWHIHAAYRERFRAWLSLWNPQTVRAFGRLLRRIQPDVVNAHNIHYLLSYHTLKLARDAGCGVVFSAHDAMTFAYGKLPASFNPADFALRNPGDYRLPRGFNLRQNRFRYNPVRNRIIKHYLERHAHIRTAPSQALADAYAHNSMPAVEVVHNGIELDERQLADTSLADDLRRRLNLVGKRVILIAGRLTVEKGLRQILLALNDLHQQFPQLRLLILTSRELDGRISEEFAHFASAALCWRLAERGGAASRLSSGGRGGGALDLCRSLSDGGIGSDGRRQTGGGDIIWRRAGSRRRWRNRLYRESIRYGELRQSVGAFAARTGNVSQDG